MAAAAETSTAAAEPTSNPFRDAEKRFRRAEEDTLRREVIDFGELDRNTATNRGLVRECAPVATAPTWLRSARVFELCGVEGFRFICNPFSPREQLMWAHRALRSWPEPPNVTNLSDLHGGAAACAGAWERHLREPRRSTLSKLSWATLGYHYQWTPRCYDPAKRAPFPPDLAALAADLAAAAGWRGLRAEAAIVNYYSAKSTMGGHRDDAEPYEGAPIVSISVGLEAIYLIGGADKQATPRAVRVRSGDVVLQGGASRRYVHGVPRILPGTLPCNLLPCNLLPCNLLPCNLLPDALRGGARALPPAGEGEAGGSASTAAVAAASSPPSTSPSPSPSSLLAAQGEIEPPDDAELAAVAEWLVTHRLNFNVRQVFEHPPEHPPRARAREIAAVHGEAQPAELGESARVPARIETKAASKRPRDEEEHGQS